MLSISAVVMGCLHPLTWTVTEMCRQVQPPGPLSLDVPLRLGLARRLVGRGVAGHEREPPRPGVEPVAAQAAPDTVRADEKPAPARLPQLLGDPPRP
jgi:hypothetical protein